MTVSATVLADSLHPNGKDRITTILVKTHRFTHPEWCRHRAFSLSVSSSRAIRLDRFLKWVEEDPAMPVRWGKEQAGMVAAGVLGASDEAQAKALWLDARDSAMTYARALAKLGVHKEIVNRLAEPWHFVSVVTTGNKAAWANFFGLRCHPDAQPEIRTAACAALRAYHESTPEALEYGQWHTPFVSKEEKLNLSPEDACKFSAARTARTSYHNHDGTRPDPAKDLALFNRLLSGDVVHASPSEHQARPRHRTDDADGLGGNLGNNWIQFRKTLKNETITEIPAYAYAIAGITK